MSPAFFVPETPEMGFFLDKPRPFFVYWVVQEEVTTVHGGGCAVDSFFIPKSNDPPLTNRFHRKSAHTYTNKLRDAP